MFVEYVTLCKIKEKEFGKTFLLILNYLQQYYEVFKNPCKGSVFVIRPKYYTPLGILRNLFIYLIFSLFFIILIIVASAAGLQSDSPENREIEYYLHTLYGHLLLLLLLLLALSTL